MSSSGFRKLTDMRRKVSTSYLLVISRTWRARRSSNIPWQRWMTIPPEVSNLFLKNIRNLRIIWAFPFSKPLLRMQQMLNRLSWPWPSKLRIGMWFVPHDGVFTEFLSQHGLNRDTCRGQVHHHYTRPDCRISTNWWLLLRGLVSFPRFMSFLPGLA